MERSGSTPPGGVTAPDLAAFVQRPGPFVSLVLTTAPDVENPAAHVEQHWRARRQELVAAGAPERALERLDALVVDAHRHGVGLLAAAAGDGDLVYDHVTEPPDADTASVDELPRLTALVRRRQQRIPYVLALLDRRGADIVGVSDVDAETEAHTTAPPGPERKVQAGGWSQRRFQQRAENTWEHGADAVVAAVDDVATRVGARLVMLAGDVRTVSMVVDGLPDRFAEAVRVLDGGRADDGSAAETEHEAERFVADLAARDTVAMLEKLREELGQHDRAVEGVAATFAALSRAQVDALLVADVHEQPDGFFGAEAVPVAATESELRDLGVGTLRRGRAVDVAMRAALGTGARVRVVPHAGGPQDGIGALLRWSSTT